MWFTETPWPPIFIFLTLATVLVLIWFSRKQVLPLAGAGVLVLLCIATYLFERSWITDSERVEANIFGLTRAFQQKDLDKTLSYFSPHADKQRAQVRMAMSMVDVSDDLDVKDLSVDLVAARSRAVSWFRANATVSVTGMGNVGFKPSRWEVVWQREGDDWKIIEVDRMDVLQDKKIGILDRVR